MPREDTHDGHSEKQSTDDVMQVYETDNLQHRPVQRLDVAHDQRAHHREHEEVVDHTLHRPASKTAHRKQQRPRGNTANGRIPTPINTINSINSHIQRNSNMASIESRCVLCVAYNNKKSRGHQTHNSTQSQNVLRRRYDNPPKGNSTSRALDNTCVGGQSPYYLQQQLH